MIAIAHKTLDVVDAIENRGLTPSNCDGFVGCWIDPGSNLEDLPRAAAVVELDAKTGLYKVWWPDHPWTELVEDYLAMIHDASGQSPD